ncbi:MAG: DNA-binding response regulator [Planctomycetes bacterium]|nr:DNA-binding response regulator [Planctomycetota bacterium]
MAARILLVEDDPDLSKLAALHLRDEGWEVTVEADGTAAARRLGHETYDLIVLDLMLPGVDGLEICRRLRAAENYTPLIILTAKSSEVDRVLGLELGADDYLTKPVSLRELVARVKAGLRRSQQWQVVAEQDTTEVIRHGDLSIDPQRREAQWGARKLELTAKEFDLLLYFARHPGRVFTRSELLEDVWGYGFDGYEHTVNSHINRLRRKVEQNPAEPELVRTVWGVGYKFLPPEVDSSAQHAAI